MLTTRIAFEDKVVVLSADAVKGVLDRVPKPIDEKAALQIGRNINADYVAFGTLTVFGQSVSTDARFLDVPQDRLVVTFGRFGKDPGDLLAHVDMFAGQVNETVFGRKTYTETYAPAPDTAPPDDRRKHPESVFTREGGEISDALLWKSRRFPTDMRGIAVGDLDGDKKNEAVFINRNTVFVYRYTEGTVEKVAEIQGGHFDSFFGVDAADINGNGTAEIFVTNLITTNRQISSFVLEWNGTKFARILDDEPWMYSVVRIPKQGVRLLGQRLTGDKVFRNDVQELDWQGKRYAPTAEKRYLKPVNVLGLAFGELKGRPVAVGFADDDRVRIFDDTAGSELWKSTDKFGGNSLYLEFPDESAARIGDHVEMKHIYLPLRILLSDINKDGIPEVLVPKNRDFAGKYLARLRIYERGHIEGFSWDELGLTSKWKTREMPGYIADWEIADFDNDGQDEIVLAVVQMTAPVIGTEKSYIVMLELNPS